MFPTSYARSWWFLWTPHPRGRWNRSHAIFLHCQDESFLRTTFASPSAWRAFPLQRTSLDRKSRTKMATQKCVTTTTPSWPMWTTVTRRAPTNTSTTCAKSEHACTLFSVLCQKHAHPHWLKSSLESVIPSSRHAHVRLSLNCSTSPFTSTITSSTFPGPSSPCAPTTLTPWQTTCATPPTGPSSPPTIPSRSQTLYHARRDSCSRWKKNVPFSRDQCDFL